MEKRVMAMLLAGLTSAWSGRIIFPGNSCAKVAKEGTSFTIGYAGEAAEKVDSVVLVGPFNRVKAVLGEVKPGPHVYDAQSKAAYSHDLSATVPAGTPIELYDVVVHTSGGKWTSRKGLKVVKSFKSRYTAVHITDTHVSWGGTWDGDAAREMRYFDQVLRATEIIGPEYMVFTGENIHNGTPKPLELKWKNFWDGANGVLGVHGVSVPAIVSSGNHDFYASEASAVAEWNQYCGLRSFGFSYGNTRILVFDDYLSGYSSGTPDFPVQQAAQLAAYLQREGKGAFRIAIQHNVGKIHQPFIDAQAIQFGLFGHAHSNFSRKLGAATGWVTGSASHYASVGITDIGWFRVLVIDDNGVQSNHSVQFGDPNALSADLRLTFANPNAGKARENAATLTNDMDVGFESCRIRFVMARGLYRVDAGTVEQVIENDSVSVYDVRIAAAANSRTQVRISPQAVGVRGSGRTGLRVAESGFRVDGRAWRIIEALRGRTIRPAPDRSRPSSPPAPRGR